MNNHYVEIIKLVMDFLLKAYTDSLVATLQGHLWSIVCSKFHENRGILKPISQNRDMGVFFS